MKREGNYIVGKRRKLIYKNGYFCLSWLDKIGFFFEKILVAIWRRIISNDNVNC